MASLKMSRVRPPSPSSFVRLAHRSTLSQVEDYDVAYVSGVIHFDPESDIPVLERANLTSAILPAPLLALKADDSKLDESDSPTALAVTTNVLPPLPASLFIGDLRLTVLKERLKALDVPSEFAGEGVLVCGPAPPESFGFVSSAKGGIDPRKGAKAVAASVVAEAREAAGGRVAVKKAGRGRLVIEGTPGQTYYVVRRVVYSMHGMAN